MNFPQVLLLSLLAISLTFAQKLKPTKSEAVLHVTVTDFQDRPYRHETIQFIASNVDKVLEGTTDSRGKFSLLIPKGVSYDIQYMSLSGPYLCKECGVVKVPMNAGEGNWTIQFDNTTYSLEGVFFETGQATLRRESFRKLDELVAGMKRFDTLRIEIAGHTDNVGGFEYNMELSQARANSVRDYLLNKGIAGDRVKAVGYGFEQPVADNSTESGRASNRRTEVRILNQLRE